MITLFCVTSWRSIAAKCQLKALNDYAARGMAIMHIPDTHPISNRGVEGRVGVGNALGSSFSLVLPFVLVACANFTLIHLIFIL